MLQLLSPGRGVSLDQCLPMALLPARGQMEYDRYPFPSE